MEGVSDNFVCFFQRGQTASDEQGVVGALFCCAFGSEFQIENNTCVNAAPTPGCVPDLKNDICTRGTFI